MRLSSRTEPVSDGSGHEKRMEGEEGSLKEGREATPLGGKLGQASDFLSARRLYIDE